MENRRGSLQGNVLDKIAANTMDSSRGGEGGRRRTRKKKATGGDDEYEYDYPTPEPPPRAVKQSHESAIMYEDDVPDDGVQHSQPQIRAQTMHPGPMKVEELKQPAGMVQLPRKVELTMPGGPEVSKFSKRKKKAKHGRIKVFQDAANSCRIDIDDDGNLECVMLSDDLANTFLKFGRETYGETEPICLQENRTIPLTTKKKAIVKDFDRTTAFGSQCLELDPWETVSGMGQNKKYKKVKLKKTKLKGKCAKVELLYAAEKADLVVDEYTDKIGKVYVAIPDKCSHKTYLYGLPERLNIITEEFSKEIPIRRAVDDKANWYVQDTSSEESDYEDDVKPEMCESGMAAVAEGIPGPAIGFGGKNLTGVQDWKTRMVME